jgi:hypothetical protein
MRNQYFKTMYLLQYKKYLSILLLLCCSLLGTQVHAQNNNTKDRVDESFQIWLTGSSVPGGEQRLVPTWGSHYQFVGSLVPGTVMIEVRSTNQDVHYLQGIEEKPSIVNHGMDYTLTADKQKAEWWVDVAEDCYRIDLDWSKRTLHGEIVRPWNELFIGGGALPCGWDRLRLIPFKRDPHNPYIWVWTGKLSSHEKFEEPSAFKMEGQLSWGPKQLHPIVDGEDILRSHYLRQGGPDSKWSLRRDGYYRLTIDLLHLTVKAEQLK